MFWKQLDKIHLWLLFLNFMKIYVYRENFIKVWNHHLRHRWHLRQCLLSCIVNMDTKKLNMKYQYILQESIAKIWQYHGVVRTSKLWLNSYVCIITANEDIWYDLYDRAHLYFSSYEKTFACTLLWLVRGKRRLRITNTNWYRYSVKEKINTESMPDVSNCHNL